MTSSVLLSLWFWLPAIAEKSEVVLDTTSLSNNFKDHFVTLEQLVFSPLKFGYSYLSQIDSVSLSIGLTQVFTVVLTLILLIKNKLQKNKPNFWSWLFLFSILLKLGDIKIEHFLDKLCSLMILFAQS